MDARQVRQTVGKARGYAMVALSVVLGYTFLYMVCTLLFSAPSIGSASVPERELDGQIRVFDMNTLTASAQAAANNEKVLILTPMAKFYPEYWENLEALTYPHKDIELGFIVPDDEYGDAVLKQLTAAVKVTQENTNKDVPFAKVHILRQDTPSPPSQSEHDRHAMSFQKERRGYQALARNSLVFTTLGPSVSWVLWLDADVVETPHTLLEDLTGHNKDVIVANCYQRYTDDNGNAAIRPYDYNSWVDSERARELAAGMGNDDILVEGYAEMATYRTLMAHLYDETSSVESEMELDGVGGTALLVKADVHRDGAMFPPFPFYNLIETEGFAKMVKRLGYKIYGLPNYLVYHYNQ